MGCLLREISSEAKRYPKVLNTGRDSGFKDCSKSCSITSHREANMKIEYLGHAAFRIETGKTVMLIDPFLTGNPAAKTDWQTASKGATHVLLSHGHSDHVGDSVDILKATGATLVANFEVCNWIASQGVEKYSPGNHGGRISLDEFDVVFTNAHHSSSMIFDGKPLYLGHPSGFVIIPKAERGKTIYLMGDTGLTLDMKLVQEFYKPVIGIVPIGDRFTMGPDQAAYACRKFFKFKTIIPSHYASFSGFVIPDAKPFLKAMGPDKKKVKAISAGESVIL
jgi:L-ascorbate metabolism protein UlaG (beta-lactamase superfamily)